jgi:hypothetical protein
MLGPIAAGPNRPIGNAESTDGSGRGVPMLNALRRSARAKYFADALLVQC